MREVQTMNWLKELWACIPKVAQVEAAVSRTEPRKE